MGIRVMTNEGVGCQPGMRWGRHKPQTSTLPTPFMHMHEKKHHQYPTPLRPPSSTRYIHSSPDLTLCLFSLLPCHKLRLVPHPRLPQHWSARHTIPSPPPPLSIASPHSTCLALAHRPYLSSTILLRLLSRPALTRPSHLTPEPLSAFNNPGGQLVDLHLSIHIHNPST